MKGNVTQQIRTKRTPTQQLNKSPQPNSNTKPQQQSNQRQNAKRTNTNQFTSQQNQRDLNAERQSFTQSMNQPVNIHLNNNNQFHETAQYFEPEEPLEDFRPDFYSTQQQFLNQYVPEFYNPFSDQQQQVYQQYPQRGLMRNFPLSRSRSPATQAMNQSGRLTAEQIQNLSVEQIIKLSNQNKQQRIERNSNEIPQRLNQAQFQNPVRQRSISGNSYNSSISQPVSQNQNFYPSPSYDSMIEDKVFSLLQNYFGQKGVSHQSVNHITQTPLSQPNGMNIQQQGVKIEHLQTTMGVMNEEIQKMRRFIQDLHISVTEKDAEIVKLKLNLGDDHKNKSAIKTKKVSLNESRDVMVSNQQSILVAENELIERLQEENQQLKEQIHEQRENFQQEMAQLQSQYRTNPQNNNTDIQKEQERVIAGLREDCLRMQEEVQKALKIHKANKVLQEKISQSKIDLESAKNQMREVIEEKNAKIDNQNQQIEKLQAELSKAKSAAQSEVQRRSSILQNENKQEMPRRQSTLQNESSNTKQIELQNQVDRLSQELNSLKKTSQQTIQILEQQLKTIQAENGQLQNKIRDLGSIQTGQDLTQQAEMMEVKDDFLRKEETMKKQIKSLENQVAEKTQVLQQLQMSLSQISEVLAEREGKIKQQEGELKKNKDQVVELKKQVDGLGMQITKDCEIISETQAQEAKARQEIVGLKKMIQTLTMQLSLQK